LPFLVIYSLHSDKGGYIQNIDRKNKLFSKNLLPLQKCERRAEMESIKFKMMGMRKKKIFD